MTSQAIWDQFNRAVSKVQEMSPDQIKEALKTEHDEVFSDHWTDRDLKVIIRFLEWVAEAPPWLNS